MPTTINENAKIKKIEEVYEVDIDMLESFKNHPYGIREDEKYIETRDSIKEIGVTTPLIIRPKGKDKFEIISGHRRKDICEKLKISKVPCIIRNLDNDSATIQMVDSNLQRDTILPSEKAKAYQMKYEALKRQGKRNDLTSSQVGTKLRADEVMAQETGESRNQVQRWIHLNKLIPQIMDMIDGGEIKFNPAVEISYLTEKEQIDLLETMESEERTPSTSQAQRMKELSKQGLLDMDTIFDIMTEQKGNEKEVIKFELDDIQQYFPNGYTIKKIMETIEKLLQQYFDNWKKKQKDRDDR